MVFWQADTSAPAHYRDTYLRAVETARSTLDQKSLNAISVPQGVAVPKDYLCSDIRLLIMGQETRGNLQPLSSTDRYAAWASQIGSTLDFDYAYSSRPDERGSFWQAYEQACQSFGYETRRRTAWSNVAKVQLLEPINDSYSIYYLPGDDQLAIIDWQKELFLAELAWLKPDAILFLTGRLTWILDKTFANFRLSPEGPDNAKFNVISCENLNIPMVQTYHPNAYRVANRRERRDNALAYLKSKLGMT